ncbi:Inner membrane ABC transporter permease protein YcjO [archaeon HR06]|nr:Inner membrane ABC transporter permease protein YcjO [archaeon HR06]
MRIKDSILGWVFLLPLLILLSLLIFFPIVRGIYLSFFDIHLARGGEEPFVGLDNYIKLANDQVLPSIIQNTLIWVFLTASLCIGLGLATALFLDLKFRGKAFLIVAILIPWVLPDVDVGALWKWLLDTQAGVINQFLYLAGIIDHPIEFLSSADRALFSIIGVMVWRLYPFVAILILTALQVIPPELYEAASVDGASPYKKFRYITLPNIAFTLIAGSLILSIWLINNFAIIWIMTGGGPIHATDILGTYIYKVAFQFFRLSDAAVISVISFSIILTFSLVYLILFRKQWTGEL